jgi:predicted PurR-regulated permease PerM
MLGALLLIGLLFGSVVAFGTALSGPAASWAAKLPEGVPRLQEHLSFLSAPIETMRQFLQQAEGYVSGDAPATAGGAHAPAIGSGLWTTLFAGTRAFVGGLLETVLVLFFLLLSGDIFLRRLVEILPRFSDKRQAIEISQHIEHDISAYLVTVTIMNAALLARRFTLNPVLVITALIFWYWMWGVPGAILAVQCSRSRRSFATGSGGCQRSVTFLRDSRRFQRRWHRSTTGVASQNEDCCAPF